MGIFKKRFKIRVTIWGPDYTGTLDEAQDWFNRWQLIPRIGDAVPLPSSLRAAVSRPDDDYGSRQETVTVRPEGYAGIVSSVFYSCHSDSSLISVGVRESVGEGAEVRCKDCVRPVVLLCPECERE